MGTVSFPLHSQQNEPEVTCIFDFQVQCSVLVLESLDSFLWSSIS